MIATWSPRVWRWASRHTAEALSRPSSNHLIATSPSKLVFLMIEGLRIQSMRSASAAQKCSGSRAAWFTISRYFSPLTWAEAAASGLTWNSGGSDMVVLPFAPTLQARGYRLKPPSLQIWLHSAAVTGPTDRRE